MRSICSSFPDLLYNDTWTSILHFQDDDDDQYYMWSKLAKLVASTHKKDESQQEPSHSPVVPPAAPVHPAAFKMEDLASMFSSALKQQVDQEPEEYVEEEEGKVRDLSSLAASVLSKSFLHRYSGEEEEGKNN